MSKVQRGRWSTKINVLKQDRIIYDDEGYHVGFHDGRYKLGKYTINGFSDKFYRDYELGYDEAHKRYDKHGYEIELEEHFQKIERKRNNNNNIGCLGFILIISSIIVYSIL